MKHRLPSLATACAALAALASPGAALAALPSGTLSYVTPAAVVDPNQQVEVWVQLNLDPGSAPLSFSSNPLTGFASEDLPPAGNYFNEETLLWEVHPFAAIDGAYLNTYFSCSGTFTLVCDPGPNYAFNFWLSSEPGRPSINFLRSFTLAPGGSFQYLFGTFDPVPGGAAPGTYTFYENGLTLSFYGVDAEGRPITSDGITLATACPTQEESCAFTRTVAVPEPSSYGLMALGLAGLGLAARRRRLRGGD